MGSGAWDDHGISSLVQSRTISANFPVVLCAPHGGNAIDGNQAEELRERGDFNPCEESESTKANLKVTADVKTAQLLEAIDCRLKQKILAESCDGACWTGAVVARFHRMYIDANRALEDKDAVAVHPSCAKAAEVHERYHRAIESAIEVCSDRRHREGARVLLLDIHGQMKFVDKVLIGTRNGTTADLESLNTPGEGFLWHLRHILDRQTYQAQSQETRDLRESIVVMPRPMEAEVQGFTGGYTVRRHGSADVDAVQLEFGRSLRDNTEARETTAEAVATAIFRHLHPLMWFFERVDRYRQTGCSTEGEETLLSIERGGPAACSDVEQFTKEHLKTETEGIVERCSKKNVNGDQDGSECSLEEQQKTRSDTVCRLQCMGVATGRQLVEALGSTQGLADRGVEQPESAMDFGLSAEYASACIRVYNQMLPTGNIA